MLMLRLCVWFRRFANKRTRRWATETERLNRKLVLENGGLNDRIEVLRGHIALLEDVVARERARVSAETQLLARTEAEATKAINR